MPLSGPRDARADTGIRSTRLPAQFLRFTAVGVVTTAVQYLVLWSGVVLVAAPAAVASAIGYVLGVLLSYLLNYRFTFRSAQLHRAAVQNYFAVFGMGWAINTALMALFVHHWGWSVWPSQVLATGVGLIWNFSGSRWWTFRQQ